MASVFPIKKDQRHGKRASTKSGPLPIRVLIANTSSLMGKAVASLLNAERAFEVVGVVKCCADCCNGVAKLRPDVVLCDLDSEEECGSRCLDRFRNCLPDVPTVVLSSNDNEQRLLRVVRVGIQGFLTKDASPGTLFDAIRSVNRGSCFLEPRVQSKIMGLLGGSRHGRDPWHRLLSDRERRILHLMSDGLTNEQIANELCLSKSAVKYHNAAIFKKLGVTGRAQAVKVATQQSLVT